MDTIEAKIQATDLALKFEPIYSEKPIIDIDLGVLPKLIDKDEFMEALQKQGTMSMQNATTDKIERVLSNAKKIYEWLIKTQVE